MDQPNININNMIEVEGLQEEVLEFIREDLIHDNPKYLKAIELEKKTFGISEKIYNFSVTNKGNYLMPRGYKDRLLDILYDLGFNPTIQDFRSTNFLEKEYKHNIQLRDYQAPALTAMSNYAEGTLVAPAGSGKTVMGIGLILMCNQKCLWVTHTKQLLHQFVDRIQQHLEIDEDDIGLIYKGEWTTDRPITAGLIQTLVRNTEALAEIKDNFGAVFLDEAHHAPASTFTQVINNLNPYYIYGLTATPTRQDGLADIMLQNLGPVRHTIRRDAVADGIITPTVLCKNLNTQVEGGNYIQIVNSLVNNKERNSTIIKDVVREAKQGNICIITTERVKHAEILLTELNIYWKKTGAILGKHNEEERAKVLTALENGDITVLICTTHLLGEGFDYAPLNRLFLTLPIRNEERCEQLVGRVQRISPGKVDSFIYDYIDNHPLTKHQFRNNNGKRCRYNTYLKLGCNIQKQ